MLNIALIINTMKFRTDRKHIIPKDPKKFLNKNFKLFQNETNGVQKFIFSM